MKTIFTNDEFRKLIVEKVAAVIHDGALYDVDAEHEDFDGNICLSFYCDFDDYFYAFPWDNIKSITYHETTNTFVIVAEGEKDFKCRLLTELKV